MFIFILEHLTSSVDYTILKALQKYLVFFPFLKRGGGTFSDSYAK